jgi:hypothetical protein
MGRQQAVERFTVGFMHNKNDRQTKGSEAKAKPEVLKLGLDLHARQVTECRQLDGSTPKPGAGMGSVEIIGSGRRVDKGRNQSLQLLRA